MGECFHRDFVAEEHQISGRNQSAQRPIEQVIREKIIGSHTRTYRPDNIGIDQHNVRKWIGILHEKTQHLSPTYHNHQSGLNRSSPTPFDLPTGASQCLFLWRDIFVSGSNAAGR